MISIKFTLAGEQVITVSARPGQSLMEAAVVGDVPGIAADCGGGAVCGTCHVHIDAEWSAKVGPPGYAEEDILDTVYDPRPCSRLACQVLLSGNLDGLVVRIPARR